MTLQPIKRNVLLQLIEKETQSLGGIHIPEIAQKDSIWGIVRAHGEDVPNWVEDGDTVLILRESGTHFRQSNQDFVMVDWGKIKAKKV